jgi:2-dehydro-3-deoxy-D-arabinonate dehydratase
LFYQVNPPDFDEFINRDDLYGFLKSAVAGLSPVEKARALGADPLLPPMGSQEVWAAGVTYIRSREARMEEAEASGGADFYARVYEAERPELFFKATASRTVGSGDLIRIRRDSNWNVPEPELTLFITSGGRIVGYTAGNDMSSRSIEGENPLYLPQAKTYERCAALGPCLYVPEQGIDPDTRISLTILRAGATVFEGSISINRMKRQHTELAGYLFRECAFPKGVFLMTGTGIVPGGDFTLQAGDEVQIDIEHIGTLINKVELSPGNKTASGAGFGGSGTVATDIIGI